MANDTCANPLLQQWVKEWMDKAEQLNTKAYYTYKKAYDSLTRCPITYQHPSEAIALAGIGAGMVAKFERNMMEYCKERGLPMPERPQKNKRNDGSPSDTLEDSTTPVRKKTQKAYIPKYRSGGYAILLCLLDIHRIGRESVTKEQICNFAQKYCEASFTLGEGNKSYTAWNSIKNLEKYGYVYKNGRPAKYCLTETGLDIANRIKDQASGQTLGESSTSASTPTSTFTNDNETQPSRNPSSARGSRKKGKGSSTSAILDRMLEEYDAQENNGLDLSLYVSNPSEHQSISINGRTSSGTPSSSSTERPSTDILQALADASRTNKRKAAGNTTGGNKRQRKPKQKSKTAAFLDNFLANYDDSNNGPDMSNYVLNPQEHQSISVGNQTTYNKPSTSASSSRPTSTPTARNNIRINNNTSNTNSSSITNSSTSSFARSVMNAEDDDDILDWGSRMSSTPNKYSTPSNSTILQADNNNKKKTKINRKPEYNVDDYSIDLSPELLPTFKAPSSQSNINSNDIIDLFSSPEASPVLEPSKPHIDDDITFDDDFNLEEDYFPMSQSITKQVKNDKFHFTYLDVDEKDVRSVAQAAITIDEENEGIAYRIRCYTSQSDHPKFKQLVQVSKDKTHIGCSIGYLPELHMESVCPGLPARPALPLHREELDDFWPQDPRDKQLTSGQGHRNDYTERLFTSQASQSSSQPTARQNNTQPSLSQTDNLQSQSQKAPVDYSNLVDSAQLECMLPHEYEIVLILDNREIQRQQDRDYFRRKLAEKGVNVITRSLDLGDVIWVARKKGSLNQSDEVFLDYMIERKRMDDLVTSIRDGRFVEQKTRLKRSGSEKVIYLVEEYNQQEVINYGAQAIQTAMSSTQIIDGFFLKRTNNIEESIDYIVSISKLIHTIYKDTTLYTIPSHMITRQNYLDLKQAFKAKSNHNSKASYVVTYPMFSELNTKNGSTSLHEVYLRMIMTIKGVNAERALSLIQVYPTPHSLLTAFKDKSEAEAKKLIKDATQNNISRRRWGIQISERLYDIWGSLEYPPGGAEDS